MADARLDQIVKGAPAPDKILPAVPSSGVITSPAATSSTNSSDPLASLPSSPPQIYLNLLILEASLRAQYLEIRARRRQYTIFLLVLGLWNLYFGYALFLRPREDGSGVGGSVYWVVEVTERVAFMAGIVTGILVWGTGQWERGIRWPRRWVGITNRGLRGFNCKIVVVKGPWWKQWLSVLSFIFSNGLFSGTGGSSYHYIDQNLLSDTEKGSKSGLPNIHEDEGQIISHEEDLAPGGDLVKLLLLPKPFSPAFRENWDLYRTEYWERENERRRILLSKVKLQAKQRAKRQPRPPLFSRLSIGRAKTIPKDVEKSHHGHSHGPYRHNTSASASTTGAPEKRLRRSNSLRSNSHSRTSSRSSTPTPELDDGATAAAAAGGGGAGGGSSSAQTRPRRGSTASTSSSTRGDSLRKKKPGTAMSAAAASSSSSASTTRVQKLTPALEHGSALFGSENRNSFSSTDGSSRPVTPAGESESVRSLRPATGTGTSGTAAAGAGGGGGGGSGPGLK